MLRRTGVTIVDDAHTGDRWVVLGSVEANGAELMRAGCPLLIKASITGYSGGPEGREAERLLRELGWLPELDGGPIRALATEEVVRFFRQRGVVGPGLRLRGLGPIADSRPPTWVPAARRSNALGVHAAPLRAGRQVVCNADWPPVSSRASAQRDAGG